MLRQALPYPNGKVHFSSNDYLGLSQHPEVIQACQQATATFGVGSKSARTLGGTLSLHLELEAQLATFLQREATLLFSSGYQLNQSVLPLLAKTPCLIDKKMHRSLYEAPLNFKRFRHNDMNHLESLLKKGSYSWIVTESLFSMEGDFAPLKDLLFLKEKYHCRLYVDEAHALGVYGPKGRGLCPPSVDLVVGTFGKAFGCFGAFVATSQPIKDFLIQKCPGFLYTTSLPPPVVGAVQKSTSLIPLMEKERSRLHRYTKILGTESHIALFPPEKINQEQFFTKVLYPPTVEKPSIRISLTALHTEQDVQNILLHPQKSI